MKVSLNWLNEYIDVQHFFKNTLELSKILTDAGLEVDGIEDLGKNFDCVVLGQIKELSKHPDADKLTVCQVDVGREHWQQIVCGAKNHKQGDYVVAALPGAILPGDFKIKKSKIRGVESLGMLCSEKELGLSSTSDGILILPESVPAGTLFSHHFGKNDIIFELGVTANRSDCLSHIGLARELSCLLNQELKMPSISFPSADFKTSDLVSIELSEPNKCPRYSAKVVRGIKVGPSPLWLKNRLESVDINSVNNVVDITNYIMLEFGQPMHAFDLQFIKDSRLRIKPAEAQEKFVSLDGSEFSLESDDLGIYDSQKAVALAGVVGGKNSGVSDQTCDLLLEVAHFSPGAVRKTSRRLGINTDASYRFARGTDPNGVEIAMKRACHFIQKLCGGEISQDTLDLYPNPPKPNKISITTDYVKQRLGYDFDGKDFQDWMIRLGCQFMGESNGELSFLPPSWRWDLEIKEDLVEEFGRLNGYDKIPETLSPLSYEPLSHDPSYVQDRYVRSFFSRQGFSQAVNYNFLSQQALMDLVGKKNLQGFQSCGFKAFSQLATLQNPLSEEYNVMRPSLAPSLFKNLITNYRHGVSSGQIFEVGKVFGIDESQNYFESRHFCLMSFGKTSCLWQKSQSSPAVFQLKSYVENFLNGLKAKSWAWKAWQPSLQFLHPGRSATLFFEGKSVGYIGEIHPKLKSDSKIREDVAFAEFDLGLVMRSFPKKPKLKEISKFPAVERDFSFVVKKTISAGDIVSFISKTHKELIKSVNVVDQFTGGILASNEHSLTFRVLLQDMGATLSEDTIKGVHSDIIQKVQKKFSSPPPS